MGLLKSYFMHRRGGLTCPPVTQRVRTNEIVHHLIHGKQNQVAQAVAVVQNGTLGRTCKSAPTVFINSMAYSGLICAMAALFQQLKV